MTPNIAHAIEQEQRLQAGIAAVEAQVEKEADWYHLGEWDGKLNNPPNLVSIKDQAYWAGYSDGLKQYWLKFATKNSTAEVF